MDVDASDTSEAAASDRKEDEPAVQIKSTKVVRELVPQNKAWLWEFLAIQ